VVTFPRGDQIGNPIQLAYANVDPYQGSIVFWIRPEWAGDDGIEHEFYFADADFEITKTAANNLRFELPSGSLDVDISAWTAGTTYFVVVRWDSKKTLDGTNYACVSINNVHTYGITTQPTMGTPDTTQHIGSDTLSRHPANAIIAGPFIYRRVLTDGTYGDSVNGNLDEIEAIYAAGAGADPCTITGGSWDVTLGIPTDSTVGAFTTGAFDAWSHPILSSIVTHMLADDGYYGGYPYAVVHNGTSTYVDCGSAAGIDNLPNGATLTIDFWVRLDADPIADYGALVHKGNQGADGYLLVYDKLNNRYYFDVELATASAEAYCETVAPDGKWHLVTAYYADGTKTARVAFDGRWGAADIGVGAYQVDAARNLMFGRAVTAGTWFFQGAQGYVEFSNNDRHGGAAGTDFIPPRVPYDDGNTIESWHANDGTGATLTATVVSPAQDGTITSGTWEAQWEPDGTPVVPYSVEFFKENDGINFGSGANIDNLPSGDCTIEGWFRTQSNAAAFYPLSKWGTAGWFVRVLTSGEISARISHATNNAEVESAAGFNDGCWHHWAVDWDVGTLTARLFVDGV